MICLSCNQEQTITTRPAKPYSRVVSTKCGCGFHVQVVAFLDLNKVASHHPLPGFERFAIEERFNSFTMVIGQDNSYAN